ncbi:ATP-dependent Clp protease ATP-binding subunit, partial [Patescibacteria group bacterium]|nr:ATP-dependent Clp protease ATP-binding subunit [Patescibacteria group bacterium]
MPNTNNNQIHRWPLNNWIRFIQISFLAYKIGVAGLAIVSAVELYWSFLASSDLLIVLSSALLWRWVVIAVIGLSYWKKQLAGAWPNDVKNVSFLTYLDWPTRKMFWRALLLRDTRDILTMRDLLQAGLNYSNTQWVFIRLGWRQDKVNAALEGMANEDAKSALIKTWGLSSRANRQVNWSDILRGVIMVSASWQNMLAQDKISVDEALAVVDWVDKSSGYRQPKLRFGLLHDLLTPQKNLNRTWTAKATPMLDRFSRDLTELAKLGYLTSAKVRQKEVEETVQILSKSQQNSVILVGEPGVGKTSIIGDVALRVLKGDIPSLADYRLVSLDVGEMLGASGDSFSQVFSQVMREAAISGNTILFVGNLDQLGKAKTSEGFDLSSILLDALKNNRLQLVGTSDPVNYKKYIENNSNLSMWFSRVNVNELDTASAILVLEDLSYAIESRHGVTITIDAVKSAVDLSQRYIHTGKLPDKAEDILDEASAYASRRRIPILTNNEVRAVMSSKTNVPVGEINVEEKTKLMGLADKIHSRLIGQDEAVVAVVESLKRERLGVSDSDKRPIGTFLFLGPTGVGKTELAKSIAWAYFNDESKIIRLDMGEYQTRESVHNLLGAPVVSGDIALAGGSFTEAVKQTPFAVVLLDEIEKAHDEILNVFLRVLDEGKMTDNMGNTVDFTHTIIIATSNAEARFIEDAVKSGMPYSDMQRKLVGKLTQTEFTPEFINRFDGVIVFKPLRRDEIKQIAQLKIAALQQRLRNSKGIDLQITDAAVDALVDKGYEPAFGARP